MRNFTANPEGAIYGFAQTVEQNGLFRRFPQKYPIKNLFQVGAWTFPGGGYIGAMMSANLLCDRYFK
jgi:prolycopene isomerase